MIEREFQTLEDQKAVVRVEWKYGAIWGPHQGLEKLTGKEFALLNTVLYHDPEFKDKLMEAVNKADFHLKLKGQ